MIEQLSTGSQIVIAILIIIIGYITFVPWLSLTHLRGIEEELGNIRKALEEKNGN